MRNYSRLALLILLALVAACWLYMKPLSSSPQNDSSENKSIRADIARLQGLGYLGGYRAPSKDEVSVSGKSYDSERGYTLITSGHAPTALLLDASGKVVHSWEYPIDKAFPGYKSSVRKKNRQLTEFWRHATVLSNGDLLAIFEGVGIIKLDSSSKLLWAKQNGAHHDLQVLADGRILLLTRQVEILEGNPVLADYISVLSDDGNEIKKSSLIKSMIRSEFRSSILKRRIPKGDFLHSNSIDLLTPNALDKLPPAQNGDILVSLRNLHALAIFRIDSEELVWFKRGDFKMQHYAKISPSGNSLWLFDNLGAKSHSRILNYRWPEMELIGEIGPRELGTSLFSKSLGMVELLENGNLLVAESEGGTVLEISSRGEILWKFVNPYRVGRDNRLIATIPHAHRVSISDTANWIR